MKKLDFTKRVTEVEIAGKVYGLEISNYDFIKQAQASLSKIQEAQAKLKEDGGVDALLDACKSVVDLLLGDWERVWDATHHDIYNLMDLMVLLSEIVNEGLEYKAKQYV